MKITNYAIIFVIIAIPFIVKNNIESKSIEVAAFNKMQLDTIIDAAVEDSVSVMVERGNNNEVILNKDLAIQTFYNTLFLNFDVVNDRVGQKTLMGYLPAIMIVDYNGCYVLAQNNYLIQEDYRDVNPEWYPKVPYTYVEDGFIYTFRLDDYVTVYSVSESKEYEGYREELALEIQTDVLTDPTTFDQTRRQTIIRTIENEMLNQINNHNDIAHQYNLSYNFSLPRIEEEDWYRTVDDISLLVFFQGVPIGLTGNYYNNFAIGGAAVIKTSAYYIEESTSTNTRYYHREGCSQLLDDKWRKRSREECALEGAFPCEVCRP